MGRSRFALGILVLAWVAGLAGLAAWRLAVAASALQDLLAVAAILIPGAIALHGWLRSPSGTLSWNGEGWTWTHAHDGEPGSPHPVLDIQRAMLLRWESAAATRWLWLERAIEPSRWDDLRRAVYSRVPKP